VPVTGDWGTASPAGQSAADGDPGAARGLVVDALRQLRVADRLGAPAWLDPTVALVAAGVAVLLAAGALWWYRRRARPPGAELREHLARVDEVAVVMHPKPDPDAMASAIAVQRIAEAAGTESTVQYPGEIRHPENRAFLTVLDLDLDHIETVEDVAADAVVLVDHHEPRGFDGAATLEPYAVVDHHPGSAGAAPFSDVRPDYGACASIVTEYLEELNAERDPAVETDRLRTGTRRDEPRPLVLSAGLATGLAFGVLSDTTYLTRGTSRVDFAAMEYLYDAVDDDLLDRIANPQTDPEVLETRARAVLDREQRTPYVVSDVGAVDNLDAVPQAADELLGLEGVSAAAVLGEKEGTLYISARSRDDRVHVGRALESAIGDLEGAGAGGHARMGGGQVPTEAVAELRPGDGVLTTTAGLTREALRERLFDAMAGAE